MKTVTVFGSALPVAGDEEYETAYKLGELLGKAGFAVCSGGYQGIMEAVSKGCVENGGKAIGITVATFSRVPNPYLTKVIEAKTLFERIQILVETGDAFVVLRGGTGTLLELATVWEYFNKGVLQVKPVAAHGEMWKPIVEKIDERMKFENRNAGLVKHFEKIEEAFDYIRANIGD